MRFVYSRYLAIFALMNCRYVRKILLKKFTIMASFSQFIQILISTRNMNQNPNSNSNPDFTIYTVKSGDTLQSIAIQFDVSVSFLRQINHLFSDSLFPGDTLRISVNNGEKELMEVIAQKFDPSDDPNDESTKGRLYLYSDRLVFNNNSFDTSKTITLHFNGIQDIDVIIHPDNNFDNFPNQHSSNDPNIRYETDDLYYLLMINYDPSKVNSDPNQNAQSQCCSYFFSGIKKFLAPFKHLLISTINETRKMGRENSDSLLEDTRISEPKIRRFPSENQFYTGSQSASQPNFQKPQSPTANSTKTSSTMLPKIVNYPQPKLFPIQISGGTSKILQDDDIQLLRASFPPRYHNLNWHLLFQLSRDGCLYSSFYKQVHKQTPIILLLKNNFSDRYGVYSPSGFQPSSDQYYGTGETFIFRLTPKFECFRWTKANSFFINCSDNEIAIGGGSNAAIWIGESFLLSFSDTCETFASPTLTTKSKSKIFNVEAWKLY